MALQVWLPLNGDTRNYGCAGVTATNNSGTVNVGGKTCNNSIRFNKNAYISIPGAFVNNFTECSVSFWLYLVSFNAAWDTYIQIGKGGTPWTDYTFGILRNSSGSNLVFAISNGSSSSQQTYTTPNIPTSTWTHITCTYTAGHCAIYINGVLHADNATTIVPNFSAVTTISIGGLASTYKTDTIMNDFRIYDHCLSPKEVKEISKALVVHFPLNDQYNSAIANKYSLLQAAGSPSNSNWTVTKLANERGYNYKRTRTGDGANLWWCFRFPTFTFTVGKRYYYSLKCRCNKFTNAYLTLRAARSDNDWVTNGVNICSSALADGQWHEYYVSQIVNETYDRAGSTVTCNPRLEAYTSNMNGNGTVYEMDFDIKDVQVIESDTYIPFIENGYASTKVHDTSGFGNHGTVVGNVSVTSDTPRYNIATLFQKAGYIDNPNFKMDLYTFTLTFWINVQAISSQHFLFGTFDSWTYNGIGIWRDNASYTKYNFLVKSNSSSGYANKPITVSAANTWNFIAIVYTGTTYKGYLNNVLQFSDTYGDSGYIINKNLMVGNSKYNSTPASENEECMISDFRLYATALSDADILELYKTSASIDNKGNLLTYEIVEG